MRSFGYPHWTYVFVLVGIYFFRNSLNAFYAKNRGTAIFLTLWGLIIAIVVSFAAGVSLARL